MDKYIVAPPSGSTNNSVGAVDRHWQKGYFDELPNWQEYLAESTGYGIVSGCTPSISGLTVTVAAGVVHLANGTRKELSASTVTLDAADTTNPRIDLVYIDSAGVVAKITGTAAASPSAPTLPTSGIRVAQVSVAANATVGMLTDMRAMLTRLHTGIVHVKDFGAKGDGLTDDRSAIQAMFAVPADKYVFDAGVYRCSSGITVNKSVNIEGNGATIKFDSGYLTFAGSMDDYISLTNDVAQGSNEITISTNTLNANDVFLLLDDTDYSFAKYRNYYKLSDILRVKDNTGSALRLYEQTTSYFTSAHELKIAKLNVITVNINNLYVESTTDSSEYALRLFCCVDSILENVHTKYGKYGSCSVEMSLNVVVKESTAYQTGGADGYQYGFAIIESKNVDILNSVAHAVRHAVSIGTNGRGICRNITIDNCELTNDDSSQIYCADIHGSAYNITYKNNRIYGGCCVAGANAKYVDNIIVGPTFTYHAISFTEVVASNFCISGNTITITSSNTNPYVISYHSTSYLANISNDYKVLIKDNVFGITVNQTHICHFATVDSASVRPAIEITNNYLENDYTGLTGLLKWDGESSIEPREIIFRDFHLRALPNTFKLLDHNSGTLSGCKIEFPIEAYRKTVTVAANSDTGIASETLRYIPCTSKINDILGNFYAPLSAALRFKDVLGSFHLFATAAYYSTGGGFNVVVTTGDTANKLPVEYTFYVDVFVGGTIVV